MRAAGLLRIALAYLVAIGVGAAWLAWGPATAHLWLDAMIADVLATVVVFGASRLHHNSSFYDAYWSVIPPFLAFFWWAHRSAGIDEMRWWLLATVLVLWAVRLTANWAAGFPGLHHEDWRYPRLREQAGRLELLADLVAIHVIPTLQVFLAAMPIYVVTTQGRRGFGWLDVVATVVGLGAVSLEHAADTQLRRFVRTAGRGQVMDQGLWAWSRHPNYFGELMLWVSLALFGIAVRPAYAAWLWVGPAAMLAMLLGASIPMMEERSLARRPDYQRVIDTVPRLVPRPPRRTIS